MSGGDRSGIGRGDLFRSRHEGNSRALSSNKHASHMYGDTSALGNREEVTDLKGEEIREISSNLTMLRRKYDEFREASMKKEREIVLMRDELDKLKGVEFSLKDDSDKYTGRLGQLKNNLDTAKMKLEEATMNRKTYEHMLERMKKDAISYKLKSTKVEGKLSVVSQTYHHEVEKARKHQQNYVETQAQLDQLMKNIEMENKQIEDNLDQFKSILKTKKASEEKRAERIAHQKEIAESAANNKDSTERKWRKLFLVHKFLSIFLKRKMEREMSKYKVVEHAFQKIRGATSTVDANEFVTKFLTRENTYSQLLISIAEYEQKLEELRKINETHKGRIQQLQNDEVFQEGQLNDKKIITTEIDKEFLAVSERAKMSKLVFEKVYQQGIRFLKKLQQSGLWKPTGKSLAEEFPRDKFVELYKAIFDSLDKLIPDLQEENVDRIMSELQSLGVNKELRKSGGGDMTPGRKQVRVQSGRSDVRSTSSAKRETDSQKSRDEPINAQPEAEGEDFLLEQRSTIKAEIDVTTKKLKALQPPPSDEKKSPPPRSPNKVEKPAAAAPKE